MDTHFLKKSRPYKDLKPSYVIFICMKGPFNKGEAIYQFQMIDKKKQAGIPIKVIAENTGLSCEEIEKL